MGLGVSEIASEASEDAVRSVIIELGYDLNPMSGTLGEFYTESRVRDIHKLIKDILAERSDDDGISRNK